MLKLNDASLLRNATLIAGEWRNADDGSVLSVSNPANGMIINDVPDMGASETKAAIESCLKAQPAWAAETASVRADILLRWFALIHENIEDLAVILTAECGKPLKEALGEIRYGASFIQWYAEEAKRVYGETIPGHQKDKRLMVLRQPIGVVAAITPWNFPNAMVTRKVGPALAAGCAVVLKPSEETPLSAIALVILAQRAGLPDGLLNVVTGGNAAEIGDALCADPNIRSLSFTGSTSVGQKLMAQCAPTIKRLGLELGGNAPFIVFNDADVDEAVEGAIVAKFRNNGQTCVCANRIYVQSGVYDEFVEKIAIAVAKLRVGTEHDLGPLINRSALKKVEAHVSDAVSKGARLISGGAGHELGGNYFQPTILADMSHRMCITYEETFGPVAAIYKFETDQQVIDLANTSDVGLAAYVYSNDLRCVWRVTEALQTGMVGVNTGLISTEVAPLGGVKQSGLGREGSRHGLDEYLSMKYVCIGGI